MRKRKETDMDANEIKKAVTEAMAARQSRYPPRMEFSKKFLIAAFIFIGIFCAISTVSWFLIGDWPKEIAEFFVWPLIVSVVGYFGKTAIENKAKIENREGK